MFLISVELFRLAGEILKDFGVENLAQYGPSSLKEVATDSIL